MHNKGSVFGTHNMYQYEYIYVQKWNGLYVTLF